MSSIPSRLGLRSKKRGGSVPRPNLPRRGLHSYVRPALRSAQRSVQPRVRNCGCGAALKRLGDGSQARALGVHAQEAVATPRRAKQRALEPLPAAAGHVATDAEPVGRAGLD